MNDLKDSKFRNRLSKSLTDAEDNEELPFEQLLASKEVGCARQGQLIGEIAMMGG